MMFLTSYRIDNLIMKELETMNEMGENKDIIERHRKNQ